MRKTLPLLLAATLTVSACATVRDSRVNPFNWFGNSKSVPVAQTAEDQEAVNPLIPRRRGGLLAQARAAADVFTGVPFQQVTDLRIERVPGGAIIRATGLAARQGVYDVQLTPQNEDEEPVDGVLTYRLEGEEPKRATPVGAVPTREVTAGRRLSDQQLRDVRTIRVEGQLNAQIISR